MMTWYQLDWCLGWRIHSPDSVPDPGPSLDGGFRGRLLYLLRQTFLTTALPPSGLHCLHSHHVENLPRGSGAGRSLILKAQGSGPENLWFGFPSSRFPRSLHSVAPVLFYTSILTPGPRLFYYSEASLVWYLPVFSRLPWGSTEMRKSKCIYRLMNMVSLNCIIRKRIWFIFTFFS